MRPAFLLFLAATALSAQMVEGRVVNELTGAPVAGVRVALDEFDSSQRTQPFTTTTGGDGRFRFDKLPEGVYTVRYTASGYFIMPGPGSSPSTSLAVTAAAATDPIHLEAKLQPSSKISGRVLDSEGKPVKLADVWLMWSDRWCSPPVCIPITRQVRAWVDGTYNVNDLDLPGAWLLAASAPDNWPAPPPRDDEPMALTQTFYPNASDSQLAEAIVVRPGVQLWNVDIKLNAVRAYHVRGRILDTRGNPAPKAAVVLAKGFGPELTAQTKPDGSFEFPAVTEAGWRLSASLEQTSGKEKVKLWAAQWIEVHRADLDAPDLRLNAPFTLAGKVILQAPENTPAPRVPNSLTFLLASSDTVLSDMRGAIFPGIPPGGEFSFHDIYPGAYKLEPFGDPPASYYLESIRLGGRDVAPEFSILSAAETLVLTYKQGGGTVRGTGQACVGAVVLLVPAESAMRRAGMIRTADCDAKGKFEFASVRPGDYYAFTAVRFAQIISFQGALYDQARLKLAAKVTVRDHESVTAEIR